MKDEIWNVKRENIFAIDIMLTIQYIFICYTIQLKNTDKK